ncbi:MAG: type II secretion system protein GspJ [Candidatus Binataceae bacterium]
MNTHSKPLAYSRGFTLIEMMLAVLILGLILAMLASSFSAVAHSKVHGEARLAVDRAGRAILWEMSNELAGAVQTVTPSNVLLIGKAHAGGAGAADSVTVSTLNAGHRRTIGGFGPEEVVSYSLVANPDESGWYMLERSESSGLASPQSAPASGVVLADNVLSLHLRYFDGQTWLESWDTSSLPRSRQLPIAVTIDLQLAAPYGYTMDFATEVTVPMAMGFGMPPPYNLW